MNMHLIPWRPDADIFGEAAGLVYCDRILDLVATPTNERCAWDVVDGCDILASGIAGSMAEAKRAAETAARREVLHIA
ncbi:hypothetical protein ACK9YZ_16945 [Rhizobium sp. ZK1]|uniref:hypothetical protein n=1 Tax=Rhizobium sp. ZK1 TaxID=3389872 RepID=UPI0039F65BC8